ncbi:MAG: ketopantoate reductase family protein [Treponema sp.]|jgi:2-dehydropantoate 2-reductase|nr:ketopantoate reductase family protein [Treponema sp.]
MQIQHVAIIGLGALGVMYGHYLEKNMSSGSLRFIADKTRAARYRNEGVFSNGEECHFTYTNASEEQPPVPADLLLFAVKFSGLEQAIKSAAPFVGRDTVIVSVLNGITSEQYLAKAFGKEKVLLCTVQGMDAEKTGNRAVNCHMGSFAVGTFDNTMNDRLKAVDVFFDSVGLSYTNPPDMTRQLWNKLLLNDGVNQTTAVFETNYGGIQVPGKARETMIGAMKEVVAVAKAHHIDLRDDDITAWLAVLDSLDPKSMPSMRQDTLAGRRTEVELFSGTIIAYGRQAGVATPVNQMLYDRLKGMEASNAS